MTSPSVFKFLLFILDMTIKIKVLQYVKALESFWITPLYFAYEDQNKNSTACWSFELTECFQIPPPYPGYDDQFPPWQRKSPIGNAWPWPPLVPEQTQLLPKQPEVLPSLTRDVCGLYLTHVCCGLPHQAGLWGHGSHLWKKHTNTAEILLLLLLLCISSDVKVISSMYILQF